jgi:hypothetical protein
MLYAGNKSLFNLAVCGFSNYFKSCSFLFIARDLFDTKSFIEKECELLGIDKFETILLENPTKGQAETVFLGLTMAGTGEDEPITIFNIDTFRPNFIFPGEIGEWDGYLEVFKGEGANWSYAKTESNQSTKVIETAEKVPISNYCSTGLYFFKSAGLFKDAFQSKELSTQTGDIKELYVAPLYNVLIKGNKNIHIHLIEKDEVAFCGVPDEYYAYLKKLIRK